MVLLEMNSNKLENAPKESDFEIDPKDNYCICGVCGYVTRGFAPEECPICQAGKERFSEVEDSKTITSASLRVIRWTESATKRLQKIPQGLREMNRWRIEAFARGQGFCEIDNEVIDKKYKHWEEAADEPMMSRSWSAEALEKVERIPSFVRGMVIKEVERYARDKGIETVTPEIISEVRDEWTKKMKFHSEL
jgi:hypothetical protein